MSDTVLSHLENIMRIYLQSTEAATDDRHGEKLPEIGTYLLQTSDGGSKQALRDSLNNLTPSFRRFKRTKSYSVLYAKVREFEEISQKLYG